MKVHFAGAAPQKSDRARKKEDQKAAAARDRTLREQAERSGFEVIDAPKTSFDKVRRSKEFEIVSSVEADMSGVKKSSTEVETPKKKKYS